MMQGTFDRVVKTGLVLGLAGAAAACGGNGSDDTATGTLTLRVTDAPVDAAERVVIQFSGLELQGGGERLSYYYCEDSATQETVVSTTYCGEAAPKSLDLLSLTGGESAVLLDGVTLPAGHYQWIRLMVDTEGASDSYIVLDGGAEHELVIPGGDERGLHLNRGFVVPAGGSADFTIDFDLRKSVHQPWPSSPDSYTLRPTLRIVDNALTGSIVGTVDPALALNCNGTVYDGTVYVYGGQDVAPDDVDGSEPDPVTTAGVHLDDSGEYRYRAAFLEAGAYTAAFTCDAGADDPATEQTMTFIGAANVTVAPNAATTQDF